jgi:hypothetical protein
MLIRWMRVCHQRSGSQGANMTNGCIALGWAHGRDGGSCKVHARFMHALFQVVSEGLGTVVQGPLAILKVLCIDHRFLWCVLSVCKNCSFFLRGDDFCTLSSHFNGKATVLCGISFMLSSCRECPSRSDKIRQKVGGSHDNVRSCCRNDHETCGYDYSEHYTIV